MTLPPSSQQQSQHFLLKWNNHRSNMVNVFENLLQSENLVDVTIAVEGKFLKAHKIVLSACSPYFESMFVSQTPSEKHPILIFHDMKFAHLKTLLDFMYRGEISIDERDLSDVLKVAEALSIRGLSSFESDDEESEKSSEPPGPSSTNNSANNTPSNNNNNAGAGGSSSNAGGGDSSGEYNNTTTTTTATSSSSKGSKNNHPSSSSNISEASSSKGGTPTPHNFTSPPFPSNASASSSSTTGPSSDNHSSGKNPSCDQQGVKVKNSTKEKSSSKSNGLGGGVGGRSAGSKNASSSVVQENSVPPPPVTTSSPSVPIKRKRGRQPKKIVSVHQPPPPPVTVTVKQQQFSFSPSKSTLPPRQGVRRRIPRRFSGVASRIKREKLDPSSLDPEEDSDMLALLGAELGSEALSEMSVRGLDLFKYASVEDGVYKCIACEKLRIPKTFKNKYSFQRHAFLYHEGNMRKVFPCPVCSREFSRPDKMKNHLRSVHEGSKEAGGSGSNGHSPINDDSNTMLVKGTELHDTCDF